MKKIIVILLALAMMLSCSAFAEETAPAPEKDIMILFTSDVHCGVDQGFGYVGLKAIRDYFETNSHVVLVDNGDSIQGEPVGTMTKGETVIRLMNAAGYDIATIGNHEFDYGMDRFLELTKLAEFAYISANFTHEGELVFDPYIIKEFDGVKVAFVGVTTPKTFITSTPIYFQDEEGNYVYGFCEDDTGEALYAAVQSAVDAARAEGADYVICMAHLGIKYEASPWTSTEVIENTNGIDVLLDGHSHSVLEGEKVLNKDGEEVLHVACGTKLANIGYCKIGTDGKISGGLFTWTNDIAVPTLFNITNSMTSALASATEELNAALEVVVATSQVDLTIYDPVETDVRIVRCMETNLGDLCADAYRSITAADVALVNGGSIRISIPAGDITMNDVLKVHPFGNKLCMVEATGQQILDALEWTSRNVPGENGGFLHCSGLTYEIHTYIESSATNDDKGNFTGVTGEYRVKNVMINGEPLDPEATYTVASHNYLLKEGGDGTNVFMGDKILLDEIMLDNQVLITYVSESLGGVIGEEYSDPYGQGRIVIVTEPAE